MQSHNLVNIATFDMRIHLDIRYATTNNICNTILYPVAACFVHKDTAAALKRVQDRLEPLGLFIKIFDGYRPLAVQWLMWNHFPDERYVANPAKSKGRHTRGTAVDITLVDKEGNELLMPTGFDDMTERAHSDYHDLPDEVKKNRQLLHDVMMGEGFTIWPYEWWHFDLQEWNDDEKYPPLDIALTELVPCG